MPIQTRGLSYLGLRVTDLARSKRFYSETLGFPVMMEFGDIFLVNANGLVLAMRGGNPTTGSTRCVSASSMSRSPSPIRRSWKG